MMTGKPVVMIVDDDHGIRKLVSILLSSEGYEVMEAANGKIAQSLIRERPADLVITDIVMPDKEGIEVIQILKKESPKSRIIAISGAALGGQYLKVAKTLGADAVLQRPFKNTEFMDLVRQVLSLPA